MKDQILLCVDVGGTKIDYSFIELTSLGSRTSLVSGRLLCADFASFHEALVSILNQCPQSVSQICIAAAGPILNKVVSLTNLNWCIDQQKIQAHLSIERVVLVNDLTAVMWGIPKLPYSDLSVLNCGTPKGSTRLVVAPGTGLGVGISLETDSGLVCLPSEGGHVSFSPRNQVEQELLSYLLAETKSVSAETVCSGIGLGFLFRFLTRHKPCLEDLNYRALGPWLAKQFSDVDSEYHILASQTYDLFFDMLAEICGNLAVTVLPRAGIYLSGGLMGKLGSSMNHERFMARVLDRFVQQGLLDSIPIYRIKNKKLALVGGEQLLLNKQ